MLSGDADTVTTLELATKLAQEQVRQPPFSFLVFLFFLVCLLFSWGRGVWKYIDLGGKKPDSKRLQHPKSVNIFNSVIYLDLALALSKKQC